MKQTILMNLSEFGGQNEKLKNIDLTDFTNNIRVCDKCSYSKTRQNVVVGEGEINSNILVCGECPGPEEDKAARPFIGRAGKLLRQMLVSCGLELDKIYITNIVRCKPSKGLNPDMKEVSICSQYLKKQIEIVKPEIILSIGRFSSAFFLGGVPDKIGITKISGKKFNKNNRLIFPIVHPSYILRNHIEDTYLQHFYAFMEII